MNRIGHRNFIKWNFAAFFCLLISCSPGEGSSGGDQWIYFLTGGMVLMTLLWHLVLKIERGSPFFASLCFSLLFTLGGFAGELDVKWAFLGAGMEAFFFILYVDQQFPRRFPPLFLNLIRPLGFFLGSLLIFLPRETLFFLGPLNLIFASLLGLGGLFFLGQLSLKGNRRALFLLTGAFSLMLIHPLHFLFPQSSLVPAGGAGLFLVLHLINLNLEFTRVKKQHRQVERWKRTYRERKAVFKDFLTEARSPLTLAVTALDSFPGNPEAASKSLRTLLKELDTLLDGESLREGREVYHHIPLVNLSAWGEKRAQAFNQEAAAKGVAFYQHIEKGIYIIADPRGINQLFLSLLDNALKYTRKGGRITLSLRKEKEKVILEVKDTGKGILPEKQPYLFRPYYRGEDSRGTGLGLFLVKQIVRQLEGQVRVKSFPGKGSLFTLILPVCEKGEGPVLLPEAEPFPSPPSSFHALDKGPFSLLIVEDNQPLLEHLESHFSPRFKIHSARDGEEGLSLLERIPPPDLILTDIMMEPMDGFTMYEKIREQESFSHIPVIFLSAWDEEQIKQRSFHTGGLDFIPKPFKMKDLELKVNAVLDQNRRLKDSSINTLEQKIFRFLREGEVDKTLQFEKRINRYKITRREKEIIRLILEGRPNKEIASRLFIAETTVKNHITAIFKKVDVKSRVELVSLFTG